MTLSEDYCTNSEPNPELICHYTNHKVLIENILFQRQFKFSQLAGSHDPLEYEDFMTSSASVATGSKEVALDDLKKRQEMADRFNDLVKHRVRFASFCVDRPAVDSSLFNKACFRSRMWSQYAVGHTGACVVFSRTAMLECVKSYIGPSAALMNGPITYKNDRRALFDLLFFRPGDKWRDESTRLIDNANEVLLTKVEDYQQEQEFRICYLPERLASATTYDLIDCSSALAGVIVGSNFHRAYFETVCALARKCSIPALWCRWLNGAPLLSGMC